MKRALLALFATSVICAQTPDIAGDWNGVLAVGPTTLHLAIKIVRSFDGLLLGRLNSVDQLSIVPIDTIQVTGDKVRLEIKTINGTFEGSFSTDRNTLKGNWSQGASLPLELTRGVAPAQPMPSAAALASVIKSFGMPIDVQIPTVPIAVPGPDGRQNLVYEDHLTNTAQSELHLSRIEIMNGETSVVSYEGADLNGVLQSFGPDDLDKRVLHGGMRTVAYVLARLGPGEPIPSTLHNRITLEGVTIDVLVTVSPSKPIVLGPPLRGTNWFAGNGPSSGSSHRRGLITIGNRLRIPERFAIDWVRVDEMGRTFSGGTPDAANDNKAHYAYGSEVLAVADATVVEIKDGIPENTGGPASRAVPITLETIGGNYVVLDLGGSRFAFYAHLQLGSLRVKGGDKVKRGAVLGLLGNSGNSTEPHLHFQVTDGREPLGSEGIPYLVDSFYVMDSLENLGANALGPKLNAFPLDRMRVRFAEK